MLWSLAFLFIPASIANVFQINSLQSFVMRRWQLRGDDFIKYRQSGDILQINDEAKLVDF